MSYDEDDDDDFIMGDIPSTLNIVYEADQAVRRSAALCAQVEEPEDCISHAAEESPAIDDGFQQWIRDYETNERTFA